MNCGVVAITHQDHPGDDWLAALVDNVTGTFVIVDKRLSASVCNSAEKCDKHMVEI